MRQHIFRLAVGLFLALFASQSMAAGSDKYRQYQEYLQTTEYDEVAMAMDANGLWGFYAAMTVMMAKVEALQLCREHSKRSETCKIVDVSGLSAWWRGGAKGNPASSSYVSSSAASSSSSPEVSGDVASVATAKAKAEAGDANAMFELGKHYARTGNQVLSAHWTVAAAQAGHQEAKKHVLPMCQEGLGDHGNDMSYQDRIQCISTFPAPLPVGSKGFAHERECEKEWRRIGGGEAIENAWETGNWDNTCWDYVSDDGDRWVGSNKSPTSHAASSDSSSSSGGSSRRVWCATAENYTSTTKGKCIAKGGKIFTTYTAARTEHRRLKAVSSSGSSSSSSAGEKIWCATAKTVKLTTRVNCEGYLAGKVFSNATSAAAEHRRLRSPSSTSFASLTIRSNVRGDRVYIDGKYKGSTRLDLDLPKGRHTIRIEKEGYRTHEKEIDLKNALTLRVSLEKIAKNSIQTLLETNKCPGCDLTGADLTGADLTGADLTRADLTGADLTGADLTRADLTGANLQNAKLGGADLRDANLMNANFHMTRFCNTTMPDGSKENSDCSNDAG